MAKHEKAGKPQDDEAQPGDGWTSPKGEAKGQTLEAQNPQLNDPGVTHHAAPVAEPEWPEPAAVPGDEARVSALLGHLAQVTDVGSLATVLHAVVAACKRARVKPAVLTAALGEKKAGA